MTLSSRPWRDTRLGRFVLAAGIVAAQLVVFEAALRTWGTSEAAPSFQSLFMGDPHVGYRLLPGSATRFQTAEFDTRIAINASGVRDAEEIGPKRPGEHRTVILGDSIVMAVQVDFEETFGEILEARLNESGGRRHRVINGGVQGYGPVQYMLFFRHVAAAFEPDLVVVTLYVGNDAEEAAAAERVLAGDPPEGLDAVRDTLAVRLRRLVRRSMVLQVLRLRAIEATRMFRGAGGPPEPPLQSYAERPVERISRGLAATRRAVEEIAADASRLGAPTIVMLMPARLQIDDDDYGRLREIVAAAGGELRRDAASERFADAVAGLPVRLFDVLPALRLAAHGPDLLFFEQTAHLTAHGHQVVAEAMHAYLMAAGLLDLPDGAER
jgi:lysophospholipase L1-like esterase